MKTRRTLSQNLVALVLFSTLLLFVPRTLLARVYIDITSPYLKKIPIAVPYLNPVPYTFENDLLGRKISRTLSEDLTFHGYFSILDPAEYGGRPNADFSDFRLDFIVKGSLKRNGNTIVTEFRLFDTTNNRMLVGRRYNGTVRDYREMAHRFCDLIIQAITGEHGVSLSKIVFVGEKNGVKEIYSTDFDGANLKRETFDRGITVSPRISPNGKYIAYTSYRTGRPYLYLKNLKTKKIYRLSKYSGLNISPAWHPNDPNLLAVTLSKDGNPDIYLIDIAGRIRKRLTKGPGINVSPTFSPDGEKLAFVSDRSGSPQIYVMHIRSGLVKRLTYEGSYNTGPQWSPRGNRIAYTGRVDGRFQIFTISPDGGAPVQLTYSGNNENPSWSPDGRQIVFSSTRLGRQKSIFVMFANGRSQRRLFRFDGSAAMPNWGPNRR